MLAGGLTYRQISSELDISENTLKTHVTNAYNKLGINNKIEMMNLLHGRKKIN
ncbi:MAG: helix-turn-helix transcriptional regulator [Spirochaetes bacterium]|nr:helix-turn-helix transcriptional regulator [Spirochaetota bacterium]